MVSRHAVAVRSTKIVEALTGIYVACMCAWIWLGSAFTHVFKSLWAYSDYEPFIAAAGVIYGAVQVRVANHGYVEHRAWMALFAVFFMSAILIQVVSNQGWRVLGVPALGITIALQAYIFMKLRIYLRV